MAIVVIGGQARKVGKTSVVAGLIAALPEYHWTAVKISQHGHGSAEWEVTEEHDRSGESDTSRFLAAGAARALWVRAEAGHLADAVSELKRELSRAENAIVESNSVMKLLRPDVYLLVLDPGNADFKDSAREFIDFADAIILDERSGAAAFNTAEKRVFRIKPPAYVTPEIVSFVRGILSLNNPTRRAQGIQRK